MSISNKLVPIPNEELPKLRDIYKKEWPKYYIGYHTIDNYYQWLNKDPNNLNDVEIFSLNNDWSDGTYLILDGQDMLINTCADGNYSKISALLSLVDWSRERLIFGYCEWIREEIENFISTNNMQATMDIETIWYYLPKEDAIKYDIRVPEGFTLKQLTEENAETVNSLWPHRSDETVYFVKRLIRYNPSVGIFDDANKQLIGWMLRNMLGTVAILQVKEEYYRRGFGSLCVKSLSKRIATEMHEDISATVLPSNTASRKMFEKLGFKGLIKVYWTQVVKKN